MEVQNKLHGGGGSDQSLEKEKQMVPSANWCRI